MSENLIEVFQDFRTILCVCPCCGDLVRVSDLHLTFKGRAPRTWLDAFEGQLLEFGEREAKFLEEEDKIRKAAIERGRQQVVETACGCIDERIARLKYDPYDIKALFHPVDFVVFNGMNKGEEVEDIVFLSLTEIEDNVHTSLKSAIEDENYSWRVARVTAEGSVEFE